MHQALCPLGTRQVDPALGSRLRGRLAMDELVQAQLQRGGIALDRVVDLGGPDAGRKGGHEHRRGDEFVSHGEIGVR
ncbi:hypothetical protein D9M68_958110 [compost metagenome]